MHDRGNLAKFSAGIHGQGLVLPVAVIGASTFQDAWETCSKLILVHTIAQGSSPSTEASVETFFLQREPSTMGLEMTSMYSSNIWSTYSNT